MGRKMPGRKDAKEQSIFSHQTPPVTYAENVFFLHIKRINNIKHINSFT